MPIWAMRRCTGKKPSRRLIPPTLKNRPAQEQPRQSSEHSAELDGFITTVRRFVRDELLPAEAQVEEDDDIPQHITNKLSRRDQPSVGRTARQQPRKTLWRQAAWGH